MAVFDCTSRNLCLYFHTTINKTMSDNLARNQKYFNCSKESELKYVSGLYSENQKVYDFLVSSCKDGKIKYSTHAEVYALIKKELGLDKKG